MSSNEVRSRAKPAEGPSHAEIVRSIEDGLERLSATMLARFDAGERRMDRIETAIRESTAQAGGHEARLAALEADTTQLDQRAPPQPWWARWVPFGIAALAGVGFLALIEHGGQIAELIRALRND